MIFLTMIHKLIFIKSDDSIRLKLRVSKHLLSFLVKL